MSSLGLSMGTSNHRGITNRPNNRPLRLLERSGGQVLALPVLVLGRGFQPVTICTVRQALRLVYSERANVLDEGGHLHDFPTWATMVVRAHDDAIGTLRGDLRAPRIVRLHHYSCRYHPAVRLTRKNVMLRDGLRCQYCGDTFPEQDLDIDHVMPRCRGGQNEWQNLVTSCQTCNRRKGGHTPQEAHMPLRSRPRMPHWSFAARLLLRAGLLSSPEGSRSGYPQWEPFLRAG